MRRYTIEVASVPDELRSGVQEIMAMSPRRFGATREAVALRFEQGLDGAAGGAGLAVSKGSSEIIVRYGRPIDAFRALGRLLGETAADGADFRETPRFDMVGAMVDVSRNGVIRPDAVRALLRHYALMGVNTVLLYAEDTYEVPGEPLFGYLRGAYTEGEMRELDGYAAALGIEMFPCIQTLGHMAQVLQWPAYRPHADTGHILLAEDEKTDALIEKMIKAASAPFRSKRIHIGMDEAHGLGTGQYRKRHGDKNPFDIFTDHLRRVRAICGTLGLEPMIWSDMYFRLGSEHNDYYDQASVIPPEVVERIPKDVQLVYWDYYHLDQGFYEEWIDRHRALGSEPVVAGGIWTWNRFWATLPFSFNATDALMGACRAKGVREVFMTMWGDGGMECDIFSSLPGLQYFAEQAYTDAVDPDRLRANFRGSCDAAFDDWVRGSDLDAVPCLEDPARCRPNISKWLLWQDPLLSIMDTHLEGVDLGEHYDQLAADLTVAGREGGLAGRLHFPAQLASVLAIKAHLRRRLAAAYTAGDRAALEALLTGDLARLRRRLKGLWKAHRALWMSTYKPFGWEVVEGRYGALQARLETLGQRLRGYLDGEVDAIPELAAKLEPVVQGEEGDLPIVDRSRVTTPSVIK